MFLSGRLSSSSKDGSKRFGCHLCSNIVKRSRNGAANDRDRAQSKETWKHGSAGSLETRRQAVKSGVEAYPNLMLLIKSLVTWHKAFSSPNLLACLGVGVNVWVHCHCGKGRDCREDNRAARDQSQNFLNENIPWMGWKYFRKMWRQAQESVLQMMSSHAWNSRISYAHRHKPLLWLQNELQISKIAAIPFDVSIILVIKLCCQNFWADRWAQLRWHCAHTDTSQSISCEGRKCYSPEQQAIQGNYKPKDSYEQLIPWLKGANEALGTLIFQKYYSTPPRFSPMWNYRDTPGNTLFIQLCNMHSEGRLHPQHLS